MRLISIGLCIAFLSVSACERTYVINPNQPTPNQTPTPSPTPSEARIQYRVNGNANSVRVRYSNERDGLIQTTTTLPFFTTFTTKLNNLFLSLEVTPISYSIFTNPFLSAQIFVDGDLFREATSSEFILNTISVNGTWRR